MVQHVQPGKMKMRVNASWQKRDGRASTVTKNKLRLESNYKKKEEEGSDQNIKSRPDDSLKLKLLWGFY